jgi:hypothetical protein
MIDISRLRESNNWMDEDVRLTVTCGTDCKLSMGAMHWISRLESNDPGPAKLVEVKTQLGRCI